MSSAKKFLEGVHWFTDLKEECSLSQLPIDFNIYGLNATQPSCHSLKQVHGTKLVEAKPGLTDLDEDIVEGDGIFTREKKCRIAIKTADCLPIILCDQQGKSLYVLHAGWRSLLGGILQKTVKEMSKDSREKNISVLCGPCISRSKYEVGPEVIEAVSSKKLGLSDEQIAFCVSKGKADRWHLDLTSVAVFCLMNSSVLSKNISALRSCTFSQTDLWPSYRRSGIAKPSIWTCANLN